MVRGCRGRGGREKSWAEQGGEEGTGARRKRGRPREEGEGIGGGEGGGGGGDK